MLKKKYLMTLVKDGKVGFIEDHCDEENDYCNRILPLGREIELNSKYNMGKWEFIAKEQG